MTIDTLMRQEALSAPDCVARLLDGAEEAVRDLVDRLRREQPRFALTVARGSSDHAASYARYMFETALGLVTASAAPSVVTAYKARLAVRDGFVLGISQSGQSPDLLGVFEHARAEGAVTAALVNVEDSPLAALADHVLPLRAGPERSVAATKSFIGSLAALAHLTAVWAGDAELRAALAQLPERLREAAACDWSAALPILTDTDNLLVVARGRSFAVAQEMALKFKETAAVHAEPFSSAEVLHGPVALVEPGFPVLMIGTRDETFPALLETARVLREAGAQVLMASTEEEALALATVPLPLPAPLHPGLDPILAVQAFYPLMAETAVRRGNDPDRPRHLRKVTRTT